MVVFDAEAINPLESLINPGVEGGEDEKILGIWRARFEEEASGDPSG